VTSRVARALKVVVLVVAAALLVSVPLVRSRDRNEPVVEVIELSGSATTTTRTAELDFADEPIEIAPPPFHFDDPRADDDLVDVGSLDEGSSTSDVWLEAPDDDDAGNEEDDDADDDAGDDD
jgi:hypothetical protein